MKKIILATLLMFPVAAQAVVKLENPLRHDINSIPALINNVIKGLLGVVGALALFFLIWGGIMWMTSSGSSEKIKKGKDTIVWAIFGLAMIFLSYAVISLVLTTLVG